MLFFSGDGLGEILKTRALPQDKSIAPGWAFADEGSRDGGKLLIPGDISWIYLSFWFVRGRSNFRPTVPLSESTVTFRRVPAQLTCTVSQVFAKSQSRFSVATEIPIDWMEVFIAMSALLDALARAKECHPRNV